jgi:hypothetical protein
MGAEPAEYEKRVIGFFDHLRVATPGAVYEISFLYPSPSNKFRFMMAKWPH